MLKFIHKVFLRNTNKIRYLNYNNKLLLNLRPNTGLFTLSFYAAKKIIKNTTPPRLRAIVENDISNFIKRGRNVFCKHVIDIDDSLRPLDEVIVVNQNDELLALGKIKIPVPYIKVFSNGMAINVRKGINKSKI
jgi:predicted RNA-binding protein (TIGR00451 family)